MTAEKSTKNEKWDDDDLMQEVQSFADELEEEIFDDFELQAGGDAPMPYKGKIFVLDTNILIDDPEAIFKFDDNSVCVTEVTLQELDGLKKSPGDKGYNARKAIRALSRLAKQGSLLQGVKLENEGTFRVITGAIPGVDSYYEPKIPDDRIIEYAQRTRDFANGDREVILVTNDVAMQVKANIAGIHYQGYKNVQVSDSGYTGRREIAVPDEEYEIVTDFLKDKSHTLKASEIEDICGLEQKVEQNELLTLTCGNQQVQVINKRGELMPLDEKLFHPHNINPRNAAQKAALQLLGDDAIPLVILKGPAGCAKTFLALATGLDGVYERKYDKVIISRNNVLADNDIGFLPGDMDEKMSPLLAPFFDNLDTILRAGCKDEDASQIQMQKEYLLESGKIEIASVAYMRGRTLTNSFIIIDEVQNTSPTQALTIVSRIGEGSKIVLCGDLDQIDAPYLSRENNGLAFAANRMRGSDLCGQFTFGNEESVRSPLAYEAAKRMKLK